MTNELSVEDAIELLKEKRMEINYQVNGTTQFSEALDIAIKALEQTRWISVSERPPEEEGLYIVSVKNDHDRRYSKTGWFHGNSNWFSRQDVIAWMPLPEPYKESEEE